MASNFPGPYEVEIIYTAGGLEHRSRLNCDANGTPSPGDAATAIDLKTRGGGTVQLDTAVGALTDLFRVIYNDGDTFDSFNFWKYAAGTFDRTFITSASIGTSGQKVGAGNDNHANIYTFRTIEGGVMKIVLLDSTATEVIRQPAAGSGADNVAIFDFVVSTSNWILARDTSYPITANHLVGGENEALFKKRNR